MVELGSKGPFGQSFDNRVFFIPALAIILFVAFCGYKLYNSIQAKGPKPEKKTKRDAKKTN